MLDHVRFVARQFAPRKHEAEQVNPSVYGEELARWLRGRFEAMGYTVSEPCGEEWGWWLEVRLRRVRFLICCGNCQGSRTKWVVWAAPTRGFLSRVLRRANAERVAYTRLLRRIDALLQSEPGIFRIEWFEVDGETGREKSHSTHPLAFQ